MTRLAFADLSERPLDEVIWDSTRWKLVEYRSSAVGCARGIGIKKGCRVSCEIANC
jgi:hypothetical protein